MSTAVDKYHHKSRRLSHYNGKRAAYAPGRLASQARARKHFAGQHRPMAEGIDADERSPTPSPRWRVRPAGALLAAQLPPGRPDMREAA